MASTESSIIWRLGSGKSTALIILPICTAFSIHSKNGCTLRKLPAEIRLKIFEYCFTSDVTKSTTTTWNKHHPYLGKFVRVPGIMIAMRTEAKDMRLYNEIMYIFYRTHSFSQMLPNASKLEAKRIYIADTIAVRDIITPSRLPELWIGHIEAISEVWFDMRPAMPGDEIAREDTNELLRVSDLPIIPIPSMPKMYFKALFENIQCLTLYHLRSPRVTRKYAPYGFRALPLPVVINRCTKLMELHIFSHYRGTFRRNQYIREYINRINTGLGVQARLYRVTTGLLPDEYFWKSVDRRLHWAGVEGTESPRSVGDMELEGDRWVYV